MYGIIIIILLIILIFIILGVMIYDKLQNDPIQYNNNHNVRDILINDSSLHRLLMIETLTNTGQHQATPESPEVITFNKITTGINLLGKILIDSFGPVVSQRITTLMHKRSEIIRNYYILLRNTTSTQNLYSDNLSGKSSYEGNASQNYIIDANNELIESYTTSTLRQLESISHEIIDTMAASFNIRNVNISPQKLPLAQYQRLFNLLSMYDKELINQAKAYNAKYYIISMNCSHSAFDIADNFSDELFTILTRNSKTKTKISV